MDEDKIFKTFLIILMVIATCIGIIGIIAFAKLTIILWNINPKF